MNIIHNHAQKFVPNNIFNQAIENDHEYLHEKNILDPSQNKENISEPIKKGIKLKKTIHFQDKTNLKNQSHQDGTLKPTDVLMIEPQKFPVCSVIAEDNNKEITQVNLQEFDKIRKSKPKKKVSPKKNNLKQLFESISQKADNDCIFLENLSEKNSQTTEKTSSNHQNFEQGKLPEVFQQQSRDDEQDQQQSEKYPQTSQKFEQKKLISLFKINKFHFLHNDLNLDSSSEDDEEACNDIKKSSSSQNNEEMVDFDLPKIRPRSKLFIKKEDLDFEDSDDSEEQVKENQSVKEIPFDKDKIKEEKEQVIQEQAKQKTSGRTLTVTDFRRLYVNGNEQYLKKSLPCGVSIDFILKRDKSKRNSDSLEYQLYDSKTLRMIAVIQKKSGVHEIMAKKNVEDPKVHPDIKYLTAKLESNFLGSQFILKYVSKSSQQLNKSSPSKYPENEQIAETISYETNILGLKGPRKINIYIPENEQIKYYGDKSLEKLYEKKCNHRIVKYINKQAKWNSEVQSYVLNLKGKARLSSVKNFVIVKDPKEHEKTGTREDESFVIFGKVSKEIFNLSINGPFSIIQGLAVAMSTFERKLTCE